MTHSSFVLHLSFTDFQEMGSLSVSVMCLYVYV